MDEFEKQKITIAIKLITVHMFGSSVVNPAQVSFFFPLFFVFMARDSSKLKEGKT